MVRPKTPPVQGCISRGSWSGDRVLGFYRGEQVAGIPRDTSRQGSSSPPHYGGEAIFHFPPSRDIFSPPLWGGNRISGIISPHYPRPWGEIFLFPPPPLSGEILVFPPHLAKNHGGPKLYPKTRRGGRHQDWMQFSRNFSKSSCLSVRFEGK